MVDAIGANLIHFRLVRFPTDDWFGIEHEVDRHIEILASNPNTQVEQETRGFDAILGTTYKLRSKADTPDYRYMPDPELAPLVIPEHIIEKMRNSLPELPDAKRERLEKQYGLREREVDILVKLDEASEIEEDGSAGDTRTGGVSYFEQVARGRDARIAANW
jgi:aspartyl-tRNA(Asn)/glutamyl-tRNA(Gln) amidotransferase subunit B